MIRLIRRLASPRNLVATALVVLALGGTAAAGIRSGDVDNNSLSGIDIINNSITGLDIRNGSVTTTDIRNGTIKSEDISFGAITSKDVKNRGLLGRDLATGTVTGIQVDEGTLEKVPAAQNADAAANADKLDNLDSTAFVAKTTNKHVMLNMSVGDPDVAIAENGPISVYARCTTGGGNDKLQFYAKTTTDGAIMFGDGDTLNGSPFLDTTTLEADREFNGATASATNNQTVTLYDYSAVVVSADFTKAISMDEGSGGFFWNYGGKDCGFVGEFHMYG